MELYAGDMFFRGNNERERAYDCCLHGKVVFKVGGRVLSDDTEWCVSASAYRFLHTLFENHFMGSEDFLIPCCGHTLIPSEDGTCVHIVGCTRGIDFNIIHENENIAIISAEDTEYRISFENYKNAVLSFVRQVMNTTNPARLVNLKTILTKTDIGLLSRNGTRYMTKPFPSRIRSPP